jgi:hypothetical protein
MTQDELRTILVNIFSSDPVNDPQRYIIVPKQGNWWNPQDRIASPGKPSTWIAFLLRNAQPRVLPYYQPDYENVGFNSPISTVINRGKIELQFVGDEAESLAQSVQHWLNRFDVQTYFYDANAQLMADDLGRYEVSNFGQYGENSVLAYNTEVMIEFANNVQTNLTQITSAIIGGTIT